MGQAFKPWKPDNYEASLAEFLELPVEVARTRDIEEAGKAMLRRRVRGKQRA